MHFSATVGEPGSNAHGEQDIWLLCGTGSFLYALPLARVTEIMPVLHMEPVTGTLPCVRGLSIIRGVPTPVIDVSLLFGGSAGSPGRLVAVNAGARIIALAVEKVVGLRPIAAGDEAFPLPPLLREVAADIVSAIGHLDAELLLFLGSARIVPDGLLERLDGIEAAA
jgi:purine-binding chemotaxis protein CheW